jgi:hypothetical protein
VLPRPGSLQGKWWACLARALSPCSALPQKAARFALLYPSAGDLVELGRLRVVSTRASLAMVIADRK